MLRGLYPPGCSQKAPECKKADKSKSGNLGRCNNVQNMPSSDVNILYGIFNQKGH